MTSAMCNESRKIELEFSVKTIRRRHKISFAWLLFKRTGKVTTIETCTEVFPITLQQRTKIRAHHTWISGWISTVCQITCYLDCDRDLALFYYGWILFHKQEHSIPKICYEKQTTRHRRWPKVNGYQEVMIHFRLHSPQRYIDKKRVS